MPGSLSFAFLCGRGQTVRGVVTTPLVGRGLTTPVNFKTEPSDMSNGYHNIAMGLINTYQNKC